MDRQGILDPMALNNQTIYRNIFVLSPWKHIISILWTFIRTTIAKHIWCGPTTDIFVETKNNPVFFFFFFFLKMVLSRSMTDYYGILGYYPLNCQSQRLSSALSSACDFKSHFCKQCGPRSDCSFRSSLIRVHTVCLYAKICLKSLQEYSADNIHRWHFQMQVFLGILRVNTYHAMGKFSRWQFDDFFLIFPRK